MEIHETFFDEKISIYNETFAQLGKNGKSVCYISHEGQLDKKSSDICNFYYQFLNSDICENMSEIIFKCDNCYSQNKNWLLFSNMIKFINEPNFKPNCITIDYYEKGHTFQAADSVHSNISSNINKTKNIYNYTHMSKIIENSRQNLMVKNIEYSDVYKFCDNSKSQIYYSNDKSKKLYINDIKSCKFTKDSIFMEVKTHYNSDYFKQNQ